VAQVAAANWAFVERCPSDHFPHVFSTYPKYCYNFLGVKVTFIEGTQPIPSNTHQVRMEFKYDDGGLAKGGTVSLYVDGQNDGEGRLDMTVPMTFSGDETCNVGRDEGSPVSPDCGPRGNGFSGTVN
jgi:hypothetical protein